MEKELLELINKCKGSVSIIINGHRDCYESVKDNINADLIEDIELDVLLKMQEMDTMVELQFYPKTPIGFYRIYHYDLSLAIKIALSTFE